MSRQLVAYPCTLPAWRGSFGKRLMLRYLGVDRPKSALGAASRQAFDMIAYTGSNGGGKTFCAVYDLLPTLAGQTWQCRNIGHVHAHEVGCRFRPDTLSGCTCELAPPLEAMLRYGDGGVTEYDDEADQLAGLISDWQGPIPGTTSGQRLVWSTTPLLRVDEATGRKRLHPFYRPLRSLRDLVRCEHGDALLDEVQGIADARDHQSMPAGFRKMIYECRRRDVRVRWTAIDYSAADARMRQMTQAVVYARGFDPEPSTSGLRRPRRRFRWSTFDASEFDQLTAGKRSDLVPLGTQHLWRPGHVAQDSYDTLAPVLSLSLASDAGVCMACSGVKSRDKCGCPDDETQLPPGVVVVQDARGARRRVPAGHDGATAGAAGPRPPGAGAQRSEHRSRLAVAGAPPVDPPWPD